ncbi:MAG: PAS domain-containing sensor histidine kinase [Leptolyngbya sp.]|nr:PAS domain-containing sensor histidine kinase [Candidatus Melainabacteria bacterium]
MVPVLIELVFVVAMGAMLWNSVRDYEKLENSRDALLNLHKVELVVVDALLALFDDNPDDIPKKIQELTQIQTSIENTWAKIDPADHPELASVNEECDLARKKLYALVGQSKRSYEYENTTGKGDGKQTSLGSTMLTLLELRPLTKKIIEIESKVLENEPGKLDQITWSIASILILSSLIGFGATFLLVRFYTKSFLNRLSFAEQKAILIAGGKDLPAALTGDDEIAELDRTLREAGIEIKEARQKEFAILDHATDVICSLDSRFRFETAGEAASKMWQYSPDELLGRSLFSIITPETHDVTRESLQKLAYQGGEIEFENAISCGNGHVKHCLWTVTWSSSSKNYFCVAHDITEVNITKELKNQFLNLANQELRAPLEKASSLLVLLINESLLPEAANTETKKASASLTKLTELVDELLDLDSIKSNREDLTFSECSSANICKNAIETLDALAELNELKILAPTDDATIWGDEKRLVQVVTNLLSNAIKFSPRGSAISVEIKRLEKCARICVNDSGPGIPKSDRALIFEKFSQTRAVANINIKGTGLGLAIVKSIVEAHGGQVGIQETTLGGSSFFFEIPLAPDPSSAIFKSEGD